MSTLEILRAAREYITPRDHWHSGGFSDLRGAVCAVGACGIAAGGLPHDAYKDGRALQALRVLNRAARGVFDGYDTAESVNDHMGHAAVLAMFDRAIAVEEAKAAEFDVAPLDAAVPVTA